MLRVRDLEASLDFYTRLLSMKLLRRKDYPDGEFTLAFVGYGDEADHTVIELTHNWGREEPYDLGAGYGHVAIGVADIHQTCEELERFRADRNHLTGMILSRFVPVARRASKGDAPVYRMLGIG